MASQSFLSNIISWAFGVIILILGILNLVLVHPVPGIIYLFLSLPFLPPINNILRKKLNFSIPLAFLIILGLVIFWATLAITDLAEMYGL